MQAMQSKSVWEGLDCLLCPHCGEGLRLLEKSLQCPNRHSFDRAKQGYVNLLPQNKPSENYSKERFLQRRYILERGYYLHILKALQEKIKALQIQSFLDVGCGEGYYTRHLDCARKIGCDLSKEAIKEAAKVDKQSAYFVADLAKLPLREGAVQAVLDIFSPANYSIFERVAKGGYLLKVIPAENHLIELRQLLDKPPAQGEQGAKELFMERYPKTTVERVRKTFAISQSDLLAFAQMTPLFFHVDVGSLSLDRVESLTVEGYLLGTDLPK